jgi:uncharacterized membrane-anchored protein
MPLRPGNRFASPLLFWIIKVPCTNIAEITANFLTVNLNLDPIGTLAVVRSLLAVA